MLTDERIAEIHAEILRIPREADIWAFARAIEADILKAHQQAIEAAVLAEREACAQLCDKFKEGSLAAQSGSPDALTNSMLRQIAVLGHSECADAIRARTQPMRIEDAHKEDGHGQSST